MLVHAADREPLGQVILEAMAVGKPIVASDSGGPSYLIEDGVSTDGWSGRATPSRLPGCSARCSPTRRAADRLAAAGRVRAREFSVQSFAARCAGAVKQLAGQPPVAAGVYVFDPAANTFGPADRRLESLADRAT